MKKEKSETDNVYVCYCMLREMHPGKHQTERGMHRLFMRRWEL